MFTLPVTNFHTLPRQVLLLFFRVGKFSPPLASVKSTSLIILLFLLVNPFDSSFVLLLLLLRVLIWSPFPSQSAHSPWLISSNPMDLTPNSNICSPIITLNFRSPSLIGPWMVSSEGSQVLNSQHVHKRIHYFLPQTMPSLLCLLSPNNINMFFAQTRNIGTIISTLYFHKPCLFLLPK